MAVVQFFRNPQGESLDTWINNPANRTMIENKRIIYVVRANMDNNPPVYKFGVAGNGGTKTGALDRLKAYLILYGKASECAPRKPCNLGVQLYGVYGTNYNPNNQGRYITGQNVAVNKIEKELRKLPMSRGFERTTGGGGGILSILNVIDNNTRIQQDVPQARTQRPIRRAARKSGNFYAGMGS